MGNVFEANTAYDINVAIILASIETMGWKFYESLLENHVRFEGELKTVLEREYGIWKRENKIDTILETNPIE